MYYLPYSKNIHLLTKMPSKYAGGCAFSCEGNYSEVWVTTNRQETQKIFLYNPHLEQKDLPASIHDALSKLELPDLSHLRLSCYDDRKLLEYGSWRRESFTVINGDGSAFHVMENEGSNIATVMIKDSVYYIGSNGSLFHFKIGSHPELVFDGVRALSVLEDAIYAIGNNNGGSNSSVTTIDRIVEKGEHVKRDGTLALEDWVYKARSVALSPDRLYILGDKNTVYVYDHSGHYIESYELQLEEAFEISLADDQLLAFGRAHTQCTPLEDLRKMVRWKSSGAAKHLVNSIPQEEELSPISREKRIIALETYQLHSCPLPVEKKFMS